MARISLLDSDPTGLACGKPGGPQEAVDLRLWIYNELIGGAIVVIPEVIDYEVRRSLILSGASDSIGRLDSIYARFAGAIPIRYLPITTVAMRRAAGLWAQARRRGMPTAGSEALDGDVILAAQALQFCSDADDWQILTENVGHLALYVGDRARSRRAVVQEWLRSSGTGP